jgi:hypothetical protein
MVLTPSPETLGPELDEAKAYTGKSAIPKTIASTNIRIMIFMGTFSVWCPFYFLKAFVLMGVFTHYIVVNPALLRLKTLEVGNLKLREFSF